MSTPTGWKQSVATTLLDALEQYDNEASACYDAIEAGKYRYECEKIATVLILVLKLQTAIREATLLELAALRGADRPMAKDTHRALLLCRESLTTDHQHPQP